MGITSYVHIDDTVEAAIKALDFEPVIYNVTDDEPIDGETWATWYAEQLNVSPHIEFFKAQSFERGADNRKYKAQGGTLLYSTWRDGMNLNE
ncbi:hypothetical protein [Staphylococcus pseudintermedius]|uniref:hypothetical protein n=1 Tax=Staphylococcus pseudintermedius TaxID=283734 RepID=UPI003F6777EF